MNCHIAKDLVPKDSFAYIRTVMTSPGFPWYFTDNVATYNKMPSGKHFGFSHIFFEINKSRSEYLDICEPILSCAQEKFDISVEHLLRIRGGLYTNVGEKIHHEFHIDYPSPHRVLLFYVCGDGETDISQEKFSLQQTGEVMLKDDKTKSFERIEPRPNMGVLFDGDFFHRSSTPTQEDARIVISFDFI
jgi:hypothetical protein